LSGKKPRSAVPVLMRRQREEIAGLRAAPGEIHSRFEVLDIRVATTMRAVRRQGRQKEGGWTFFSRRPERSGSALGRFIAAIMTARVVIPTRREHRSDRAARDHAQITALRASRGNGRINSVHRPSAVEIDRASGAAKDRSVRDQRNGDGIR